MLTTASEINACSTGPVDSAPSSATTNPAECAEDEAVLRAINKKRRRHLSSSNSSSSSLSLTTTAAVVAVAPAEEQPQSPPSTTANTTSSSPTATTTATTTATSTTTTTATTTTCSSGMQTDAVVVLSIQESLLYDAFLAMQQQQPQPPPHSFSSSSSSKPTRKSLKPLPQMHHKSSQTTQALARGGATTTTTTSTSNPVATTSSSKSGINNKNTAQTSITATTSACTTSLDSSTSTNLPTTLSPHSEILPPSLKTSSSETATTTSSNSKTTTATNSSSKRSRKQQQPSAFATTAAVTSTASSSSSLLPSTASSSSSSTASSSSTSATANTKTTTSTSIKNSSKKRTSATTATADSKGKKRAGSASSFSAEPVAPSASLALPIRTINRNLDKNLLFNLNYTKNLAEKYPDPYWPHSCDDDVIIEDDGDVEMCDANGQQQQQQRPSVLVQKPGDISNGMISHINKTHPLQLVRSYDIREPGPIAGIVLSPDGSILATFSTMGTAKLWDVHSGKLVKSLKDEKEPDIDEFYVGRFIPDSSRIMVGGKLKDRNRWSEQDDDNHILPCPLKIFDVVKGKVVATLNGHEEEILCIKSLQFKNENYYITSSQDGYIIKWKVKDDWTTLVGKTRFHDEITCMAFTISFLPNTGNKYFVGACDDNIRLYDFESGQLMQTFEGIYSFYCDCVKVVQLVDFPQPPSSWDDVVVNESIPLGSGGAVASASADHGHLVNSPAQRTNAHTNSRMFAYVLSRGVEALDAEDNTVNSIPNTVTLHRILYPSNDGESFQLEEMKRFQHPDYRANSWLMKVSSNGRYVTAGTYEGQVYCFNLMTGAVSAILRDHEALEIRDIVFHPYKKMLFTSSDDGTVKSYAQYVK